MAGETTMLRERYEEPRLLSNYCDNRLTINGYGKWNHLVSSLGQLLKDILNLFAAHSRLEGDTQYRFQHFYNDIKAYDYEKVDEAIKEYIAETRLISDFPFEMTRLRNFILS